MSVDPALERPQPATGEGFSDAVTVAFGDARAEVFGLARIGLADGQGSGLAVLFSGREAVAVRAEGGVAVAEQTWESVHAAGVHMRIDAPLERWHADFDGGEEGGFDLALTALGEPGELTSGGMHAYEALCRVRGRARVGGREVAIDCLGQRGHAWGSPDWERMTLARTVSAWMDDDLAVVVSAVRPSRAKELDGEEIDAVVLQAGPRDDSTGVVALAIEDPRLSTAYDGEGRQRRAGFELWEHEESRGARRGAGDVICGTSLDLGRLRLDCAFFAWTMEGRTGIGRYDLLRRVDA